jgi:hypothetical protein
MNFSVILLISRTVGTFAPKGTAEYSCLRSTFLSQQLQLVHVSQVTADGIEVAQITKHWHRISQHSAMIQLHSDLFIYCQKVNQTMYKSIPRG